MIIYHLIDSSGLYGAENVLLYLMLEQQERGHYPVLCSLSSTPETEKPIEKKAREMGLELITFKVNTGLDLAGVYRIVKQAKTSGADVFHAHGYKPNILLGLIPRLLRVVPIMTTCHGWTDTGQNRKLAFYYRLDAWVLRSMDAVVLVSQLQAANPYIRSARIKPGRLHVIENGIPDAPLAAATVKNNSAETIRNFSHGEHLVGTVGRLSEEKGYLSLIRACALLRDSAYPVKLVIIGDGPQRNALETEITRLGLPQHVLITGYLPDAGRYLGLLDTYVISSLSEGLPLTLLEAMQSRTPVISTAVGGIPGVVEDGKHALLVSDNSPVQLSAAIKKVIDDPVAAQQRASDAYRRFKSHYSASTMAARYDDIYKAIIRDR